VRQHGVSKRRTWLKLHLAVDETTGEILAAVVSTNDWADSEILPELVEQIEDEIEQVSADGAYDTSDCYDTLTQRGAKPVIPPRKNAVIWQHGNRKAPPHPRDENLQMRIYVPSVGTGIKNGNETPIIIDALCLRQQCFDRK
jgi:hypothetical protein